MIRPYNPDIATITADMLARYLASGDSTSKTGDNPKPAISLNRTKTALRALFSFLLDAGYLEANPARLIKSGRTQRSCYAVIGMSHSDQLK